MSLRSAAGRLVWRAIDCLSGIAARIDDDPAPSVLRERLEQSQRPISAVEEELLDPDAPFLGPAAEAMLAQCEDEPGATNTDGSLALPIGSLEERRARLRLR